MPDFKYRINPESKKIYVQSDWRCQVRIPTFMDNTVGKILKATYIGNDTMQCTVSRDSNAKKAHSTSINITTNLCVLLDLKPYDWFEVSLCKNGYLLRKANLEEMNFESEE